MGQIRESILDFLSQHNVMTVSTISLEGSPCSASVFYVNEGLVLYFVSKHSSLHSQNLSHNPQVAVTINKDYSSWREIRGIQLLGKASKVDPPENDRALRLYLEKYPDVSFLLESINESEIFSFYKVIPRTIKLIDNTVSFGHKEILEISCT